MGIKALLLAGGLGTRLRPLTNTIPKCLVDVGGKPLLGRWFDKLENLGCESTLINTHYLANQVHEFLKSSRTYNMEIKTTHEDALLGTCGTLLKNRTFFSGETGLLIHADNATTDNLSELIKAHRSRPPSCLLTMLTFTTNEPTKCGIVELDENNVVVEFHEKVSSPPGNRANGAIYMFEETLFEALDGMRLPLKDFSTHALPQLLGKIYTYHTNHKYIDIGTEDRLAEAQAMWSEKTENEMGISL